MLAAALTMDKHDSSTVHAQEFQNRSIRFDLESAMASTGVVPSDYSAYGGEGPTILGVLWTEVTLGIILVLLRLYVGLRIRKHLGWDFFWAAVTLVRLRFLRLPLKYQNTESLTIKP